MDEYKIKHSDFKLKKSKKSKVKADDIGTFFTFEPKIPDGTIILGHDIPPDHTDPLWDKVYKVGIPTIARVFLFGDNGVSMVKTGIDSIDKAALSRIEPVTINIDKMIEVYRAGYSIMISPGEDILEIYSILQVYLEFWANRATGETVHIGEAPMEDLAVIDSLANSIYSMIPEGIDPDKMDNSLYNIWTTLTPTLDAIKVPDKTVDVSRDTRSRQDLLELFSDGIPTGSSIMGDI